MDTTAPFQGADSRCRSGSRRDSSGGPRDPRELVVRKKGREFSRYLVLSPLGDLKFLSCLDDVLLRFARGHVFANVDGTQQHADPLLIC